MGYRWFDAKNIEPLFPFGFGLSYTRFEFTGFKAEKAGDEVHFSVQVRNAGERAGAETVQVYTAPGGGPSPYAVRELKAFGKVFLQPGETQTVQVKTKIHDLALWVEASKQWALFGTTHAFEVGDSSRNLPLKASVDL